MQMNQFVEEVLADELRLRKIPESLIKGDWPLRLVAVTQYKEESTASTNEAELMKVK